MILNNLEKPSKVSEVASSMNINWKAAKKRLLELEKLGLVKENKSLWTKVPVSKEVKVL
jgi:Mn-dependent DtxR family transcriptional regulator